MYFALVQVLYELKEVIKMGGQKKTSIIRILELIEYGSIPQNEAVHRLEALLQSEIEQKDKAADTKHVRNCSGRSVRKDGLSLRISEKKIRPH